MENVTCAKETGFVQNVREKGCLMESLVLIKLTHLRKDVLNAEAVGVAMPAKERVFVLSAKGLGGFNGLPIRVIAGL